MRRRKSSVKVRRQRRRISRRRAMAAIAAGTGALVLAGSSLTKANDTDGDPGEGPRSQYLSWEDGWAYPIWGFTDEGEWVVEFDDGFYIIDPAGWVHDLGVWYAIVDAHDGQVWYSGDDDWDYCLEHDLEYEYINDDDYL